MKHPLILCLGSDIISDDGFGPAVANALHADPVIMAMSQVEVAALAGFALLDLIKGHPRVLLVDVTTLGVDSPGTLRLHSADDLKPTHNLIGSHQITLPVALNLGRQLGYDMPERVDVLGCEAWDLNTLRQQLTPSVADAVPEAVRLIKRWLLKSARMKAI